MKKTEQPKKPRYTPKPVPANSGAILDSPLSDTPYVKVMRWHDYSGKPTIFQVVNGDGHVLFNHPFEPDALAHCEALELVRFMEQLVADLASEETEPAS